MQTTKEKVPSPIRYLEEPCRERKRYRKMRLTRPLPEYNQISFLHFALQEMVER